MPHSDSAIDPYKHFGIVSNADGTITRYFSYYPNVAATPDPVDNVEVLSKDVPINQSKDTRVRIFLPRQALDSSSSTKLPLMVHFHGGGFILYSVATSYSHELCSNVALQLPVVVVSVEYRLAPEHRLPAAYDDAIEALHWIKTTQEEWVEKYADLSRCFLFGESAGGNIVYHAGLRAATQVENLLPLMIRGLIFLFPAFWGAKRTESELRLANSGTLPACALDLMWELALPLGVDRDLEYCNPKVKCDSELFDQMRLIGWKVMVTGSDGDSMIDRQIEVVKILEQKGLQVASHFDVESAHAVELSDPVKHKAMVARIKNFVLSSNGSTVSKTVYKHLVFTLTN